MLQILKRLFQNSKRDMRQLAKEGAIIVDVRTPFEFKTGHFSGAKNIPLDALQGNVGYLKDLNKTIITVCRSGARSSVAKDILVREGIEAYDAGAWTNLKV
jgi:phage shock protein E